MEKRRICGKFIGVSLWIKHNPYPTLLIGEDGDLPLHSADIGRLFIDSGVFNDHLNMTQQEIDLFSVLHPEHLKLCRIKKIDGIWTPDQLAW